MAIQTVAEAAMVVRPDFSRTGPELERGARRVGQRAGDQTSAGFLGKIKENFGKSGKTAADSFAKGFGDSGSTFGRVIATMAARVTLASAALAAAAPGVAQLTAALIPATGAAVALPAALLAARLASVTFKVAVAGVGDAVKKGFTGSAEEAKKALEELPPAARKFASSIIGLKPRIDDLRASVSGRFFKPLQDDIKPLANVFFPLLQRQMPRLAGSLGSLGDRIADSARKAVVLQGVNALFDNTRKAVDRVKAAVGPMATATGAFIKSTSTLLPGMANGFTNVAVKVSNFITNASNSGRVVQIFRNAVTTLRTLGQIVGNVGSILATVWDRSNLAGGNFLITIRNLTGQAKAFVQSAQGGGAITAIFQTLAKLGDALKTGLGAALPAIAQSIQIAAPLLQQLAAIAGRLVAALAPLLPSMTALAVQILTALLPGIISLTSWLERNQSTVQALAPVVLGLVAAQTAVRVSTVAVTVATRVWSVAVGAAKVAQAGWTAVSWLASAPVHAHTAAMAISRSTIGTWVGVKALELAAWTRSAAAWVAGTAATVANTAAQVANKVATLATTAALNLQAIATKAWAAVTLVATNAVKLARIAMLALNAAMRANPIGAVITILTLLVGAVIYAYKHSDTFRRIVDAAWKGIKRAAEIAWNWMRNTLWPGIKRLIDFLIGYYKLLWRGIQLVWKGITTVIRTEWNIVKGVFNIIKNFVTQTLPNAFKNGVAAIKRFWNGLQEAARKPVAFVVNTVVNPFLAGFQKIAGVFGVKTPDPIRGFAQGGLPGQADEGQIPGPPSARDNRIGWLKNGAGKVIGNISVATGEFIVNARDTAKALPLLRWINDGMKGGPAEATRRIGRRPVDRPGDGSDGGWAFAKGGLLGFFGDVWDVISNPAKLVQKPFNAALARIPGGGQVKEMLTGMGRKLIGGFMSWVKGNGGGAGGNVGKAQAFARAQAGKPYGWANAGPGSYDCSGIVSAVYNVLKGKNPYSHTFSTGSLPGPWFVQGKRVGPLVAGWAHPGQRGASANVGHMAGMIGGMPFESTGSRGVRVGAAARRVTQFAHIGVARADGGLVDMIKMAKVAKADFGAVTLAPGANMVYNHTGTAEPLETTRPVGGGGRIHPADLEALGQIIAREMAKAIGASNYAAGRQVGIYTRGG